MNWAKWTNITLSGVILFAMLLAPAADAADEEKEYWDATVLLIDAQAGDLAVSWCEDDSQKPQKIVFQTRPDDAYVVDARNRSLDFADIKPGDHVDVFTVVKDGREVIDEIMDRNQMADS